MFLLISLHYLPRGARPTANQLRHECDQAAEVCLLPSQLQLQLQLLPHRSEDNSTLTFAIRKYPQFEQADIFSFSDAFRKLDIDDKGYLDEATAIKATQQSERQPYDVVRQALKEVELDSSRRVELEDYVSVSHIVPPT